MSHIGLRRDGNEDSAYLGPSLALVADGVGGAAAGEVASSTVTAHVSGALLLALRDGRPESMVRVVDDAVAGAAQLLREGVEEDPGRGGMATTLTMLVCDGERVVLGHLGDSRAYRWREGRLDQLSRDHTYVEHLLAEGVVTAHEARVHPYRNVVLRCVDTREEPEQADVVEVDGVRPGDRFLVCSDGLSDLVAHERIAEVMGLHAPQAAAAVLVQSALVAGGHDNVTALVVEVVEAASLAGEERVLGAALDPWLVVGSGVRRSA